MDGPEMDEKVRKSLVGTRFEASKLTELMGGMVNWTYMADLGTPLEDGTSQVVVKHGEDWTRMLPDYKINFDRCIVETEHLRSLTKEPILGETQPSGGPASFSVRTPKLYHHDNVKNNQFTEYMPSGVNLKTYARKHLSSPTPASRKSQCQELGRAIGKWMRGYHDWGANEEHLRRIVGAIDKPVREVVRLVNYAWIPERLQQYPDELGGMSEDLNAIWAMAEREFETEKEWETGKDFQLIHGDFGPGNTLLPDEPFKDEGKTPVFIIDWEVGQLGVRAADVGNMLADLYALWKYQKIEGGLWMMQGYAEGYGEESETRAFRAAIHMGGHLLCHSLSLDEWGGIELKKEVAKLGAEIMIKGWKKDRAFFEGGEVACLFSAVKA